MKNRIIYIVFVLALFIVGRNVYAASCSLEEKTELRTMASNVSVSYVPVDKLMSNDEGDYYEYYLDVKIFNINSYLRVEVIDNSNHNQYYLDVNDVGLDGAITMRQRDNEIVKNLTFNIYGASNDCYSTALRTVKLTLPKFNYYSERAICEDIPEFYLCQKYVTYDIDSATFIENVQEYKEKYENQKENEGEENGDGSAVSKAISNVSKYRYIIAGVIVAAGIVATIIIVKKKRSAL